MHFADIITPAIDHLQTELFRRKNVEVDVQRLDLIHPVISGNKWYKLKKYLNDAIHLKKRVIITFGGAYSNHIHATSALCKEYRIESVGIIRGERPKNLSATLKDAEELGMKLFFVSREEYKHKRIPAELSKKYADELYIIKEGGYGKKGMEGAAEILSTVNCYRYTHICTAVGTGTTLAGLAAVADKQKVIGISVMKNNLHLEDGVKALMPQKKPFEILHQYHFGGYAKKTTDLISFMNNWYKQTGIPTDLVYTGKLFYAINDLVENSFFPEGSRVLIIHSGGLQGNRSLTKGTLIY